MSERSRLRLVVLQVLIVSLLATLGGRLWFLQVVNAETYIKAADNRRCARSSPRPPAGSSSTTRAARWSPTGPRWSSR